MTQDKPGLQTVAGIHAVREALRRSPSKVRRIILLSEPSPSNGPLREIVARARAAGVPVVRESYARRKHEGQSTRRGRVLAEISTVSFLSLDEVVDRARAPALFLVLDGVEDPRNFGAVARAADGAGADGLLVPGRHTSAPSDVAIAASAGALLHLPLARVRNVTDALQELKARGVWVIGLDPRARKPWFDFDFTEPVAIAVGSEGRGLRPRVRKACDELVRLPQLGAVDSLNLSVACGIVLYEAVRQRHQPGSQLQLRDDDGR
jgi:23S rRNA (guanosine2251-2'-O)-methyltransferase